MKAALTPLVRGAAGHSLGEFTAYHAVGALPLDDAPSSCAAVASLCSRRGRRVPVRWPPFLASCKRPIDEICAEASAVGEVVPANYNALEQTVISGEVAGVEKAMELAKAAGAKRTVAASMSAVRFTRR